MWVLSIWKKSVYLTLIKQIRSLFSGGSRGGSGGSVEPPWEFKLFHFRGEFWENVGEMVNSNPPWQIWTPGSKILDPPLLLKFDLYHHYLILKLKKIYNLTNKIGKDIISLHRKLI